MTVTTTELPLEDRAGSLPPEPSARPVAGGAPVVQATTGRFVPAATVLPAMQAALDEVARLEAQVAALDGAGSHDAPTTPVLTPQQHRFAAEAVAQRLAARRAELEQERVEAHRAAAALVAAARRDAQELLDEAFRTAWPLATPMGATAIGAASTEGPAARSTTFIHGVLPGELASGGVTPAGFTNGAPLAPVLGPPAPGLAWSQTLPAEAHTTLVPVVPLDAAAVGAAGPGETAPAPAGGKLRRLAHLDVLLPLVAVAIVLVVLSSWVA